MITIKEEFLTHEKLARAVDQAGYEALALWLAIKAYCGTNLTDGFIANSDLAALKFPRPISKQKLKKCIKSLEQCGKTELGGKRGPGLLEAVEEGFVLHDYLDHSLAKEQVELHREKQRLKKQKQRDEARRQLEEMRGTGGQEQGGHTPPVPMGQTHGQEEGRTTGQPQGPSRARAHPAQPSPAIPPQQVGGGGGCQAIPRNPDQGQTMPLDQKLAALKHAPHLVDFSEPHKWPEVVEVAEALGRALSLRTVALGPRARDRDTQQVLDLLDQFGHQTLLDLAPRLSENAFVAKLGSLRSLSVTVVKQAMNEQSPAAEGAWDAD